MNRALPVSLGVGSLVAAVSYALLVPSWYVAASIGGTYTGVAYFAYAYPAIIFRSRTKFDDRRDTIGSLVGLMGVNLGILGIITYLDLSLGMTVASLAWYSGAVAFVLFSTHIRHDVGT